MATKKLLLYLAWFQTLASMLGSLFFSEILKVPPCVLCWYQRIFMYPLVFILAVGIIRQNKDLPYLVLPLSLIGLGIALYHNLLQWGIISEKLAPCTLGVSCVTKDQIWFGFITIPLLSLLAFAIITLLMLLALRQNQAELKTKK